MRADPIPRLRPCGVAAGPFSASRSASRSPPSSSSRSSRASRATGASRTELGTRLLAVDRSAHGGIAARHRDHRPAVAGGPPATALRGGARLHASLDGADDGAARRRSARDGDLVRLSPQAARGPGTRRLRGRGDRHLEPGDDPRLSARRSDLRLRHRRAVELDARDRRRERRLRRGHRGAGGGGAAQRRSGAVARRLRRARRCAGRPALPPGSAGLERGGTRETAGRAARAAPPALAEADRSHARQPADCLPRVRALPAGGGDLVRRPARRARRSSRGRSGA